LGRCQQDLAIAGWSGAIALRSTHYMSLVVAAIHDDDQMTIVADTKVTWRKDEGRTRKTYSEALPKIVILRPDLAVGVTGEDPHRVIEELVAIRGSEVDEVLAHLLSEPEAHCVVAALNPSRLWLTSDGSLEDRAPYRRAWAGELSAYDLFRHQEAAFPSALGVPLQLLSSMQWLTSFNAAPTVGGYAVRAGSGPSGFSFRADRTRVGPWILDVALSVSDGAVTISATVPDGGDSTTHEVLIHPGTDGTLGALGLLIPQSQVGLLFTHERPWNPVRVAATGSDEFVESAAQLHGQRLLSL